MSFVTCSVSKTKYDDELMQLSVSEFKKECLKRKTVYENVLDGNPVKLYADFDYKPKHAKKEFAFEDLTQDLVILSKEAIKQVITQLGGTEEPKFAVKTATKCHPTEWVISFHIICTNYTMTKLQQGEFFKRVTDIIESDRESNWRCALDALPESSFFDSNVYHRGRQFIRSAYSTKENEQRHFEIAEGTFEDTIITIPNVPAKVLTIEMPERISSAKKSDCVDGLDAEEINAYLDAGFFRRLAIDRKDWINMGLAIHNTLGDSGLKLFDKFSRLCPDKYDEDAVETEYNSFTPMQTGGLTMGSIKHWAQKENPELYNQISTAFFEKRRPVPKKLEVKHSEKSFNDIMTYKSLILGSDETEIANMVFKMTEGDILLINGIFYVYFKEEWRSETKKEGDIVKHIISNTLQSYKAFVIDCIAREEKSVKIGDSSREKEFEEKHKLRLKQEHKFGNSAFINNIFAIFRSIMSVQKYDVVFDNGTNNDYLIHFANGVYDMKLKAFRPRVKTDYATKFLDYNYIEDVPEDKIQEVKKFFEQIQPKKSERDFTISYLAYALTGKSAKQVFKMNIGNGSNGKSTEVSIHEKCFPVYTAKLPIDFYKLGFQKRHKYLIDFVERPIRLAYCEELPKSKLDVEFIKDFVDGNKMAVEVMHGTNVNMKIKAKLLTNSNNEPTFDADGGIRRRGLLQRYTSTFVKSEEQVCLEDNKYKLDESLLDKFEEDIMKNAYFHILRDYVDELLIPDSACKEFEAVADENDPIMNIMEQIEVTRSETDRVGKIELEELSAGHYKEVGSKLKNMGCTYDKGKRDNQGNKGVWIGIKIVPL
jgi:hypothetical protein